MPRRAVSRDLKARIPYLAYVEGFKVKEIGRILGVKKSSTKPSITTGCPAHLSHLQATASPQQLHKVGAMPGPVLF